MNKTAAAVLLLPLLWACGRPDPPGREAYVAVADVFGGDLQESDPGWVCLSPLLAGGDGELAAGVQEALRGAGWSFYVSALPPDTATHLLFLSSPRPALRGWEVTGMVRKLYRSRHDDRVSIMAMEPTFAMG